MATDRKKSAEKPSSQVRRHLREKARREKLLRKHPPGVKEKFVSGCFAFGLVAVLVLLVCVVYACFVRE